MNESKKLYAILLAAGPSSRLGQPKQLVEYRGETLVRRAARLLRESVAGEVLVVSGCEAERVGAAVEGLPVRAVINPDWKEGMGGSIAWGARQLPERVDGILVGVCDQWLLERSDLDRLVESWRAAPGRIHVARWKEGAAEVSGPPVIFPGRMRGELKGLHPQRGARQLIDRHIDVVDFVSLESAAHDLDREEDLQRLLRMQD
ncbi:MAG: nucleotidyltransferase family protein [Lysobacterales bacterium]|jgi:molybdenum cofactor cytidylyltransferase